MARVKGRDVVIELMDAVAKLEATATKHADLLEAMGNHAVTMSVEMTALSGQVSAVAKRMDDLTLRMDDMASRVDDMASRMDDMASGMDEMASRMDDMATRMNGISSQVVGTSQRLGETSLQMGEVSQRVTSLEGEFQLHAQNALKSAKLARTTEEQLGRFARLLGDYAGQSTTRFEQIEGRLIKLERKAG